MPSLYSNILRSKVIDDVTCGWNVSSLCSAQSPCQACSLNLPSSRLLFSVLFTPTMSDEPGPPPEVDLVIVFRAAGKNTHSKKQTRDEARKAEQQYVRLIDTLTYAGLKAVGRRGEGLGQLLVFVTCPQKHLENLVRRERCVRLLSHVSGVWNHEFSHTSPRCLGMQIFYLVFLSLR